MKRILLSTALLATVACAPQARVAPAPAVAELARLYEAHDCFGMRDALRTAPRFPELAFYRAWSAASFNRPDEAARYASEYLASRAAMRDSLHLWDAYSVLGDAHVKAYRYADAARAYRAAVAHARDSTKRAETQNAVNLWEAVSAVPAQTVERPRELRLSTMRDKVELLTTEVEAGGRRLPFVWDTGAGLSTITDSSAIEMGFRIVEAAVHVGAIEGGKVPTRLAVAPELRIGGATVRNAIFLVLPAANLSFPRIDYRVRGIVGFPVIAALSPATHLREGGILLEAPSSSAPGNAASNLCLDGLAPLLAVTHRGRRLHAGFDTGAQSSSFYPPFLAAFPDAKGRGSSIGIAGVNGARQVPGLILPSLEIGVGGRTVTLPNARVLREHTMPNSTFLFGNLGQDVFRQFESMTVDFRAMELRAR